MPPQVWFSIEAEFLSRGALSRLVILQPMQGHYGKILKVNFAVAVYVAGDDQLTRWFFEIRLTRLGCSDAESLAESAPGNI